jgi:WH1 domain
VYTGYLCLIKNNAEDNGYYLRLYSLEQKRMLWQLAIKGHMKFLKTSATLISYNDRLERTLTELNFSSKSDAQELYESIKTVLMVLQIEGECLLLVEVLTFFR